MYEVADGAAQNFRGAFVVFLSVTLILLHGRHCSKIVNQLVVWSCIDLCHCIVFKY